MAVVAQVCKIYQKTPTRMPKKSVSFVICELQLNMLTQRKVYSQINNSSSQLNPSACLILNGRPLCIMCFSQQILYFCQQQAQNINAVVQRTFTLLRIHSILKAQTLKNTTTDGFLNQPNFQLRSKSLSFCPQGSSSCPSSRQLICSRRRSFQKAKTGLWGA